jgi:2-dehydropantoate 2-reductase
MRPPEGEPLHARPRATADPGELDQVEYVICLTKSFATEEAARSIAHAVGPDTWVATVQNGLGNERRLANVFGPDRVVPGTTSVGAELLEPGIVWITPATAQRRSITHFGPPRSADAVPAEVHEFARMLTEAGLPTEALESADVVIWTKLCGAATMGTLGGVLRRTVAEVLGNEHSSALLRGLFDEIVAVAHAIEIPLDAEATWEHCMGMFRLAGDHWPSMATDVLEARRTETDSFSGEIARLGAEHGVPTPLHETMWHALRAIEETYEPARSHDLRTAVR